MALALPGTRPTVLDTLASTGAYPRANSVGNVISDPDPTMTLMVPAARPAAKMASAAHGDMVRV